MDERRSEGQSASDRHERIEAPRPNHCARSKRTSITRRRLLAGVAALTGASWLGSAQRGSAQPTGSVNELERIGELRSQNGKLQGTLSTRSREWMIGDSQANVPVARRGLRYFQGADTSGNVVWPPANATSPLPGPTLRAGVGERIELTLLNHINVRDFALSGIDRDEKGTVRGCDVLKLDSPSIVLYPDAAGDSSPNCFHGSSTTNLHFHGTHATPRRPRRQRAAAAAAGAWGDGGVGPRRFRRRSLPTARRRSGTDLPQTWRDRQTKTCLTVLRRQRRAGTA